MKKLYNLIILMFSLSSVNAQAFEIRSNNANGVVTIEMRETSGTGTPTTSMYVLDIVFGLKWSMTPDIDLGAVDNTAGFNITKAGSRQIANGYHYQAFSANNAPFQFSMNWVASEWTTIAVVPFISGSHTAEITEVGFHSTTDLNLNINLVDYTPSISESVLPVTLIDFKAVRKENFSLLTWQTASELNNKGFEIQRSRDGIDFEIIGYEHGNGTSHNIQTYHFKDVDAFPGINYYKLKQVDYDGRFKFSTVVSLFYESQKLSIYPNPVVDILHLSSKSSYMIFNATGDLVAMGLDSQIDVSKFPAGPYILRIVESKLSIPFIKY